MHLQQRKSAELLHGLFVVQVNSSIFSNHISFFIDSVNLANTQCGTYKTGLCLTESRGPTLTGIIVFTVIAVLIILIVIKACLPCCPRLRGYRSVSSNSADLARSGAVVSTVAATHC